MRAEVDLFDRGTVRRHFVLHPGGEPEKVFFGVIAASDPGLIGHHKKLKACAGENPAGFNCPGNEQEFVPAADVAAVDVDDAIAIKKRGSDMGIHITGSGSGQEDPSCRGRCLPRQS